MQEALNYIDGEWIEGNPPIIGPLSHAGWMASVVFDGARAFEGCAPDLDRHAERCVSSARALGLEPKTGSDEIVRLVEEGIQRFPADTALYIRPMFYAEDGFVVADPESTRFVLTLIPMEMPDPTSTLTAGITTRRRPMPDAAPTDAKAACLYPNVGRMMREVAARGFDTAVVGDPLGHVAEFATANLFIARDDVVQTPVPNGTFLNGITRQRCISLLREDGIEVVERTITFDELMQADEVFATGNANKVQPVNRIEERNYQPGPMGKRAKELYWTFAHTHGRLQRIEVSAG